jgi:hypothetical protein
MQELKMVFEPIFRTLGRVFWFGMLRPILWFINQMPFWQKMFCYFMLVNVPAALTLMMNFPSHPQQPASAHAASAAYSAHHAHPSRHRAKTHSSYTERPAPVPIERASASRE